LQQPAFQALLGIGRDRDATIKLSGYYKFSQQPYPYDDTWPFIAALVEAFTLDRCVWGSDWPFLRALARVDYGPQLAALNRWVPEAADRERILWTNPSRIFGFKQR
jgi:predicted TIM-barrel fold metal-dependent hydrolase